MQNLPNDRLYLDLSETATWLALGQIRSAADMGEDTLAGDSRWQGCRKDLLLAHLKLMVERTALDPNPELLPLYRGNDDKAGVNLKDWEAQIKMLADAHGTDAAGLLAEL